MSTTTPNLWLRRIIFSQTVHSSNNIETGRLIDQEPSFHSSFRSVVRGFHKDASIFAGNIYASDRISGRITMDAGLIVTID